MAMAYLKLFWDALEAIEPLSDAERGRLLTALLEYGKTGNIPELAGNERFLFPTFRIQMDRDAQQYDAQCAVNRENGRLGGRPRKNPAVSPETEKRQDKDQEKEKEKDKDSFSRGGRKRNSARRASPAPREDPLADMERMERFLLHLRQEARDGI